jgi:hypothetical protein
MPERRAANAHAAVTPERREVRFADRFELKYVVPRTLWVTLRQALAPYVEPDGFRDDRGGYWVHSVYFDDDALTAYQDKVAGVKQRRKLRLRWYGAGRPQDGWLEIKERIDRAIRKRRVRVPIAAALAALGGGEVLAGAVGAEACAMAWRGRLRPRVLVGYRREACQGRFDPRLRITFDCQLHGRESALFDDGARRSDPECLDPRLAVLEVKFDRAMPVWFPGLVRQFDLPLHKFSKYGAVLARLRGVLTPGG